MPDKKLTDSEIKNILEFLSVKIDQYCQNCPYDDIKVCDICIFGKMKIVLDLINRLQAENKNLQERNVILKGLVDTQKAENEKLKTQLYLEKYTDVAKKNIKAEAYKDILNFLEDRFVCKGKLTAFGYESAIIDIKNHLKELVGDNNESTINQQPT
jgi:hypothetical protein